MQAGLLMADSTIEGREVDLADKRSSSIKKTLSCFWLSGAPFKEAYEQKKESVFEFKHRKQDRVICWELIC
jgi:hypothetical protein